LRPEFEIIIATSPPRNSLTLNKRAGVALFPFGSRAFKRAVEKRKTAIENRIHRNQPAGAEESLLSDHVRMSRTEGMNNAAGSNRLCDNYASLVYGRGLLPANLLQKFAKPLYVSI
jgi:hypothetical protein